MTEQEAQMWAKRLTRIWTSQCVEDTSTHIVEENSYFFSYYVEEHVCLRFIIYQGKAHAELEWDSKCCEMECRSCRNGEITSYYTVSDVAIELEGALNQFNQRWLNTFRRGCWLMGLPIEATAHEKAEWMQGFTKEGVNAWNLRCERGD